MTITCSNCGMEFDGSAGHYIIGDARLCSVGCEKEYKDRVSNPHSPNRLNPLQLSLVNRGMPVQEALKQHGEGPKNPPPRLPPETKLAPNGNSTEEVREAMNQEREHTEECFQLLGLTVNSTSDQVIRRINWLNNQCAFLSTEHRKVGARIQANRSMYSDEMERLDEKTRNELRSNYEKTVRQSERKAEKSTYKTELNSAIKSVTNLNKEIDRQVRMLITSAVIPSLAPNGPQLEEWTEEAAREYVIAQRKRKGLPT